MRKSHVLLILCMVGMVAKAQCQKLGGKQKTTTYKDTIYELAFDSLMHRLGAWSIADTMPYVIKSFKYLGQEPGIIENVWTSDPFFICEYPKEPLLPGHVYEYKICMFEFVGRFHKTLGFNLTGQRRIMLYLIGEFIAKK
jgi:hypothetical protein